MRVKYNVVALHRDSGELEYLTPCYKWDNAVKSAVEWNLYVEKVSSTSRYYDALIFIIDNKNNVVWRGSIY